MRLRDEIDGRLMSNMRAWVIIIAALAESPHADRLRIESVALIWVLQPTYSWSEAQSCFDGLAEEIRVELGIGRSETDD